MDLAQWAAQRQKLHAREQRFQVVRSEAHLILANLQANPAEALTGLAELTEAVELARQELRGAKLRAMNGSAPEPDNLAAAISCGWCGNSLFMSLSNDGDEDNPEWYCSDDRACQQRRAQRYPDRETQELKLARAADEYWRREAEAATFALTAWRQSRQQQETTLALTRQQAAQPRLRPSWAARHNHSIAGQALLRSRQPRH